MSDREAFVQAIAANPADDLPRLVFADWLDEHGEPERAEFIRTQIRWHHTSDEEEKKHLNRRAADLFREHWPRWLGPFLVALDPLANPVDWNEFRDTGHSAMLATLQLPLRFGGRPPFRDEGGLVPPVTHAYVTRGFVSLFGVRVSSWQPECSLAEAFRHESPHMLHCRDGLHAPRWNRFTDPVLRRVEHLTLTQQWAWAVSAPDSAAFLDDLHLAGVRNFSLASVVNDENDLHPLPVPWVTRFVRSPLAYRLTGLALFHIGDDAVPALCRSGQLHLERLSLGGPLAVESVRRLGDSDFGETVRELALSSASLGNAGVSALARDAWRKLSRLELQRNDLTAAVLPALTSAAFTPQLKELDLSDNRLFFDQQPDLDGLRALGDMLDPDRLEQLNLTDTGLSVVPDFLAERFGDRVTV